MESIILGSQQKALAQMAGLNPRKYLHILQEGAPPRWTFDLFLTPYSSAGFVASPQLGNKFVKVGNTFQVAYSTILKNGIQLPLLWQFNVPSSAGGTRPMDPLLDNLLQMRGIEVKIPDHGAAQSLQFSPLGALHSLTALSADASNAPIPAINLSLSQYQFKSMAAKSSVTIPNGGNMISTLLTPFIRNNTVDFENKRKLASLSLDTAIEILDNSLIKQNSNSQILSNSTKAAKDLLSTGFGNLTTVWNDLYNKYKDLVMRSLDPNQTLVGINDKTITPDGTELFQINFSIIKNPDLRSLITTSTTITYLAEHFAVAEYVLINNLSDSISIGPGWLEGLNLNNGLTNLGSDEHGTSGTASLMLNSFTNIAYAACLLELIDQLKAKSIFNETVIVMGGEFGRSARKDAKGSDHGYMGSSSSIYSGALTGPMILGNIYNNRSQDPGDGGTWGLGAPVKELSRALNLSDWTSTLAFLLRVPSPVTAGNSILSMDKEGMITSLIEKAIQV